MDWIKERVRLNCLAALLIVFICTACTDQVQTGGAVTLVSANELPEPEKSRFAEGEAANRDLEFIQWKDPKAKIYAPVKISQWIERELGGEMTIEIGEMPDSTRNFMYVASDKSPYNIYRIDPTDNLAQSVIVGQFAFKTKAIARHPLNGRIYYVADGKEDDIYRVAYWDPLTSENTVLDDGVDFRLAKKLAFSPDGVLFGVSDSDSDELYTANLETGEWTLYQVYEEKLEKEGDLAFTPDGTLYNINESKKRLEIVDLLSDQLITVNEDMHLGDMTGLTMSMDQKMYMIRKNGEIFTVDLDSGDPVFVEQSDRDNLFDLASWITYDSTSYINMTLTILPNSLSESAEITFGIDESILGGNVNMGFNPEGIVFDPPALLNITVYNVDLSGVDDPEDLDIFYFDEDENEWEELDAEAVIVSPEDGHIQIINAQLHHFSRYAISKG